MASIKNLVFPEELLQQIATGLKQFEHYGVQNMNVVFVTDEGEYGFDLIGALDVIANDKYWDERGDWSLARTAKVSPY